MMMNNLSQQEQENDRYDNWIVKKHRWFFPTVGILAIFWGLFMIVAIFLFIFYVHYEMFLTGILIGITLYYAFKWKEEHLRQDYIEEKFQSRL